MAVTASDIAMIERYLDETMGPDERRAFEQRLATAADLAEALAAHRHAIGDLRKHAKLKDEMRQMLDEAHGLKKGKQVFLSRNKYWKAAAMLAGLSIGIYFFALRPPKHDALFQEHYKPMPVQGTARDYEAPSSNTALKKAFGFYDLGNYAEAAPLFKALVLNPEAPNHLYLYLANCFINLDSLQKASRALRQAIEDKSSFTRQHANWYEAMIDLKLGELDAAKSKLEGIYIRGGMYRSEAKSLLDAID